MSLNSHRSIRFGGRYSAIWKLLSMALTLGLSVQVRAMSACEGALGADFVHHWKHSLQANFSKVISRQIEVLNTQRDYGIPEGLKKQTLRIDALAGRLRAQGVTASPNLVFYPASAHDSSTPLQLFPDARVIVAVDWSPFMYSTQPNFVRPSYGQQVEEGHLATNENLATQTGQAEFILARLQLAGARVRRVYEYEVKSPLFGTMSVADVTSHGVIEFDHGDGTSIQYYVHINGNLNDEFEKANAWWFGLLLNFGVDALIVKGAQDLVERADGQLVKLVRSVKNTHGVLLEDENEVTSQILLPENKYTRFEILFGYRRAHLFQF